MTGGDRFGGYQIVRLLGRGAMGEVYLAIDTQSARQVAVKVVYRGTGSEDREVLEAERLGAELQKRLGGVDGRVVLVHRYGEIRGDLFIEMEYVAGGDLSELIAAGPMPPWRAAHTTIELCEMLENLQSFTTVIAGKHFAGVVHGDLKPKNIRVAQNGQIKVIDFGIAKALSQTRNHTVNLFASAAYCSPERLETQRMDAHSDLWSVGVLLYQMLSGRLPFDEPTRERLDRRIRSGSPEPLPETCPESLRRIAFQMLARDPARRYQRAADAKADLQRWRAGQPVTAGEAVEDAANDATVRTSAPLDEPASSDNHNVDDRAVDDRTVRTSPPARDPAPAWRAAAPPPLPARRKPSLTVLGCSGVALAFVATAVGFAALQYNVWTNSERLKTGVVTGSLTEDQAWTQYSKLESRMHIPGLLWPARSSLKRRLTASADEVIQNYRNNDAPTVSFPQWVDARNELTRALQIDPGDNSVRGRQLLCQAQIDRINAGGLKGDSRQKRLSSAVAHFEQAADLLGHSPDPYLGLARIYSYDLMDMQKAEDATQKAARYGHPIGKREAAELADGYRRRADRIWRDSRAFADSPAREQEFLDKARADYVHAEDLYQQAAAFGDAARSEMAALRGQQRVEERLEELHPVKPSSVETGSPESKPSVNP